MIKNDKQSAITKSKRQEFLKSLEKLRASENDDLFNQIMINSIQSQIETFEREISEYETLKIGKPNVITGSIENFAEILIKARIVKGLSQNDLAQKAGLLEQQIQRYESTNYESAKFERMLNIANCMQIHFEPTKVFLKCEPISVSGYNADFIMQATQKLHSRRTLFTVN
jgi:transcriptional regulator with XRE-family HTH domain